MYENKMNDINDINDINVNKLETELNKPEIEKKSKIKHLVISGGGSFGLICYGILKESNLNGFWNFEDIETIYGTSVGAICGLIISLNYEWDILDNYIINRPWHNLFKFDIYSIFNSFQNNGIFDIKIIKSIFTPLFKAKDISLNITMLEHYNITKKEIHFFSTGLNKMDILDISYKTHPDWEVLDCLYYSCSLPILFTPLSKDDIIYFDGGVLCNYPLYYCIKNGAKEDEILGIKKKIISKQEDNSNLFDYIFKILEAVFRKMNNDKEIIIIPNEIKVSQPSLTLYNIYLVASEIQERNRLIQLGKETFISFTQTTTGFQ